MMWASSSLWNYILDFLTQITSTTREMKLQLICFQCYQYYCCYYAWMMAIAVVSVNPKTRHPHANHGFFFFFPFHMSVIIVKVIYVETVFISRSHLTCTWNCNFCLCLLQIFWMFGVGYVNPFSPFGYEINTKDFPRCILVK